MDGLLVTRLSYMRRTGDVVLTLTTQREWPNKPDIGHVRLMLDAHVAADATSTILVCADGGKWLDTEMNARAYK